MLQAPLVGGLPVQMGNLTGLQHLFLHCCCSKDCVVEKGDLRGSVKNGSRLNEGGCGTCFFPGRAAVIGRMPDPFKDEHRVLRIAGHRRGWCILSSPGLVAGQRCLFPLAGWVHICVRLVVGMWSSWHRQPGQRQLAPVCRCTGTCGHAGLGQGVQHRTVI